MLIGFHSNYREYHINKMFLDPNAPIGDNLMYPFFYLGKELEKLGHKATTVDMEDLEKFDAIVFIDFPNAVNTYFPRLVKNKFENLYLMIIESPIIKPDNLDISNHQYFKKIFTWQDKLIDDKKYFKINYAHKIPKTFEFNVKKEKLCTIISSNKYMPHPKELYSERIRAIRWFEKNHPGDFDLYGQGWDRYNFQGDFFGVKLARLNRLKFLTKIIGPIYPSYKGSVISKKETYEEYKFSICYENVRDFPGYITEKIFDCFFGGCVPIYWGANNITDHIPTNTFIDKRKFATYEALYVYLKNMPDTEYMNYLEAIKIFLQSEKAHPFSAEYFANTIIKEIIA